MILLFRAILIAYLLLWAALLVGCVRKREFCRLLGTSRATRLFWLATFVFFNPVLTILYLIFGQVRSPRAGANRVVLVLVPVVVLVGFFVNVPGVTHLWMQPFLGRSPEAGQSPRAHLAVIKAANNTSTTSSSAHSDNSRLACRNIAIVVEDDHPLLQRVAGELVEDLQAIAGVESVALHTSGAFPESGQRAPDIFVQLYHEGIDENLLPYSLKLAAEIRALVGRSPLRSRSSHFDTQTPPALDFNVQVEMTHTSTTEGYESVRYTLAGRNIAKGLAETIKKHLDQWRDKHGLLPEIPADFYGTYRANELPEPLRAFSPMPLGSYAGLLRHNETYYRFQSEGDVVATMEKLRDDMEQHGWKTHSSRLEPRFIDLMFDKDDRSIQIFKFHLGRSPGRDPIIEEAPISAFGVHDIQSFSNDERTAALEGLLAEPVSLERVMLFERMFGRGQRDKLLAVLERQPHRTLPAEVRLAELYQHREEAEKARRALIRANALLWSVREDDRFKSRLKSLAEKLGDETLAEAPPTKQDFQDVGFIELAPHVEPFEEEVGLDVPVVMFYEDGDGKLRTVSVSVGPSGNENDPFLIHHMERMPHGSSWGSHGGLSQARDSWQGHYSKRIGDFTLNCNITALENGQRFKMSCSVQE
ncbi:MAG: hypothetical protein JW741_21475 [Sedimentisphaerales bacterium]|nr:hypothetical protein [Sedimentisphaerales bacterium]